MADDGMGGGRAQGSKATNEMRSKTDRPMRGEEKKVVDDKNENQFNMRNVYSVELNYL